MPVGWLPGVRVNGIDNVIITNIAFENCITGVTVKNASDIIIRQNTMQGGSGIVVMSSSDISIIGNNIELSNEFFAPGINFLPLNPDASDPYHIKIEGNTIRGNISQTSASSAEYGIRGRFSDSQMTGNTFIGIKGPALGYTGSNNIITGNNFQGNKEGISFSGSSELSVNNAFYGNNFNGNGKNVIVPYIRDSPVNRWDNGIVGNYWSDYNGTDFNNDGIGDSPYIITITYHDYDLDKDITLERGKDNYPLMNQLNISTTNPELPKVSPSLPNSSELVAAVLAALTAVGIAGVLLICRKKKKPNI